MPENTDVSALRRQIKLGLLREACRLGLISQAQLAQLLRRER